MYQIAFNLLKRFFPAHKLFKIGFNISPMYRRTTAKVVSISSNMHYVKIKLPISYKNRNYVGAIFGGSMQAATDPIYMIQYMNILGNEYVVWDKSAVIRYKKPAREDLYGEFIIKEEEISQLINQLEVEKEIDVNKIVNLTNANGDVYAEVDKVIYVAQKSYYKEKLKNRNRKANDNQTKT